MSSHSSQSRQPRTHDRPRVFFYVQHLLGTGHLKRALLLVAAIREMGMRAHLISGGPPVAMPPTGFDIVQLPPVRAGDHTFKQLIDETGNQIDAEWKQSRCRALLEHFHRLGPDVVIIETFPFGRRQLGFELTPLLDAIRASAPQPVVACSVRDIVQARSPRRLTETVKTLQRFFDLVLVHGDAKLVRFEESFPPTQEIQALLRYTGYVAAPHAPPGPNTPHGEVIVSGGGGAVSARLLRTAIGARPLSRLKDSPWRILVGPNIEAGTLDKLMAQTGDGIVVERNRTDFTALLRNCLVSVSQAGYNTVMDILNAGTRSVLVPYAGDGETEQALRAEKLKQRGMVEVVTEHDLSPRSLAAAIDRSISAPPAQAGSLRMDGAETSAKIIAGFWRQYYPS